jgi:glycosyltransferase involved in cell wall biosynthesis
MKVGIIIPTRGDRQIFLSNCIRLIENQTLQPWIIEIIDEAPKSDKCDITYRYRLGYDRLRNKNLDVIAFIEDDDWYANNYLETMCGHFEKKQRPKLLGLSHTIYYNLRVLKWYKMVHSQRSSAMNTLIRPDMNFKWSIDEDPYTDAYLWHHLKGEIIVPEKEICLGIKHGIGKCGGKLHTTHMDLYKNNDPEKKFLKEIVDNESFEFYNYAADFII